MKLWLFDILACPIDKYYPLKLYIFSYKENEEQFKDVLEAFNSRNMEDINYEDFIEIFEDGHKVKDQIVMEKSHLDTYFEKILFSINELENVDDRTNNTTSKKCLDLLMSEVKRNLIQFSKNPKTKNIETILPELYLLNKIKIDFEIESGLLFCEKCKRWYPVIDTIPRMLPDKYRNKEEEKEFLKQNRRFLDKAFFEMNLKPYSLH
jgi:uncharacterized protein YbaR (Trm112 family)